MPRQFDARWFERLRSVSNLMDETEWFQSHARVSKEERELFFSNEIENPRFFYKQSSTPKRGMHEAGELLLDLQKNEKEAIVLDLYDRKLQKHLIRSELMNASQTKNDEAFYTHSIGLYGKPKKKYFAYVAKRSIELANAQMKAYPTEAKRLKRVMAKIDCKAVDISADILPPVVNTGKEIASVDQARAIFQNTIDRLEIEGWQLVVDDTNTRARFSVNPYRKIIHIPSQEQLFARPKRLTDVQLEALAEHEVGVHARRAFEGEKSGLMLLQIGLDSYLAGEEGLAGYTQQQIEGSSEFYGFDRYLAACLAIGMDGTPRDFRAVFSLMTDYYTLHYANEGLSTVTPVTAAWNVCIRIFRGTSGQTAGTIYTKDIVYMEGNIGIWHLISEKPDRFESLFLGKFNPLLSRHIRSLQTLEILKEW